MQPTANHYNDNTPRGSAQRLGERTKVTFDPPRVPVILTPDGMPTEPVQGKFGPQFRWNFEGQQVAWFDPDVHEQMRGLIMRGAKSFAITKHVRRGEPPRFEVQPAEDLTRQAAAVAAPTSPRQRAARPHIEDPFDREGVPIENTMAGAIKEAITACEEAEFAATHEDVRALAITLFISRNGGKKP
jgi:hypothetical protein